MHARARSLGAGAGPRVPIAPRAHCRKPRALSAGWRRWQPSPSQSGAVAHTRPQGLPARSRAAWSPIECAAPRSTAAVRVVRQSSEGRPSEQVGSTTGAKQARPIYGRSGLYTAAAEQVGCTAGCGDAKTRVCTGVV